MSLVSVNIISKSIELPQMTCSNFFHSAELFGIIERSPNQTPYMAVAFNENGEVVAHMLAIVRRRGSLMPPYLFTQGRIYGEGDYEKFCDDKEKVFGLMLYTLTERFRQKLCLFVELSDLSHKMFGYRYFRQNGYFSVNWQEIHNSLHSLPPEERLSDKASKYIEIAKSKNVEVRPSADIVEITKFYNILQKANKLNLRRLIPPLHQFIELANSEKAKVFITTYKNKIIGGCACVYTNGNAYLWHQSTRKKRYLPLHPNYITIWEAIKYAHAHGYYHFCFLDAGLPTPNNRHRNFLLSFGGKPVAKYRWFRFSIPLVNKLLNKLFKN